MRIWVRCVVVMSVEKKLVVRGLRVLIQIGGMCASWHIFVQLIGFLRWVGLKCRGLDEQLVEWVLAGRA